MVAASNKGEIAPPDDTKLFRSALLLPSLTTLIVYDLLLPSSAVTITGIILSPIPSAIDPLAVPLLTNDPLTLADELTSLKVGVTVRLVVALVRVSVYRTVSW